MKPSQLFFITGLPVVGLLSAIVFAAVLLITIYVWKYFSFYIFFVSFSLSAFRTSQHIQDHTTADRFRSIGQLCDSNKRYRREMPLMIIQRLHT